MARRKVKKTKSSKKRTAKPRAKRAGKKTSRTLKRIAKKSTTLKKKYSHYRRDEPMQPKNRRNPSKMPTSGPMDIVAVSNKTLTQMKKAYEKPDLKAYQKKKDKKWGKVWSGAKKVAKGTLHVIEETGKIVDKAGAIAEKLAPGLTTLAMENPEMPILGWAAGATDVAAGLHRSYHGLIDETYKGYVKGDSNKVGMKQLTDTGKYQKLMAESQVPRIGYGPDEIDLPPPDEEELGWDWRTYNAMDIN